VQIDEGDVLRFSATLEVRPKPRLGQYKGLSLTRPRIEVTDEQVEQEMQEMRDSVSAWIDTDRKQVRKGDRVYADVTVNVEGEEPMSDTDVGFHVGQGRTQPPIDEGMIDAQIGSTIDIETQYPDDFDDEDLAGKPATATVTIKRLEEHREPELNDEFAKENYGFDTLEELRADIRQRLEEAATEEAENELKQQALTKVVEGSVIEIPKRMARDGAEQRIEQLATDAGQYGMRYEDLLRAEKASHEQITARFQRASEQALERHFVIEAIAEGEGIEVSDDEVEAELTRMAEQANRPVAAVREELEAEGDIEPVRLRLREQKVLALLVESATVTEAPASEDEPGAESEETDEETPPAEADAGAEDRGDGHDADRGDATQ